MAESKPPTRRRKLTPREAAQRARRDREAEEREKFTLPPEGPNYGRPTLAPNDERVAQVVAIVRAGDAVGLATTACGIIPEWHSQWISKGLNDYAAGEKTPERHYYNEVQRAHAARAADLKRLMRKASSAHESKVLQWELERTTEWFTQNDSKQAPLFDQLADLFAAAEALPPLSPIASDVAPLEPAEVTPLALGPNPTDVAPMEPIEDAGDDEDDEVDWSDARWDE